MPRLTCVRAWHAPDAQELHAEQQRSGLRRLSAYGRAMWSTKCTRDRMFWLVMWIGLLIVSAGGIIVTAHGLAFERAVRADMNALELATHEAQSPPVMRAEALVPAVVDRYLVLAGADGPPIHSARMHHSGRMRTAPDASWMSVRGSELFVADPPGFVWWGRMHIVPGVWVDARDKLASGTASMRVMAESTFPVADVASAELDEGAAMRVLAEMTLFPTSFRDTRYVRWEPVDATSARAFLRLGGREVSAVFAFGANGLPARVSANRFRDVGGASVLTPWHGTVSDYRAVDGLVVPFRMDATWDLPSGPFDCIEFDIEEIQYERGHALRPSNVNGGPS